MLVGHVGHCGHAITHDSNLCGRRWSWTRDHLCSAAVVSCSQVGGVAGVSCKDRKLPERTASLMRLSDCLSARHGNVCDYSVVLPSTTECSRSGYTVST